MTRICPAHGGRYQHLCSLPSFLFRDSRICSESASHAARACTVRPRLTPGSAEGGPADVATVRDIRRAFYSAISTPAGGKLDQTRLRSLFAPGGRLAASVQPNSSRTADIPFLSTEEYTVLSDAQTVTSGFFDRNPANRIERFGRCRTSTPRLSLACA